MAEPALSSRTRGLGLLFQRPHRRTAEQRGFLNVWEDCQVSSEKIVNSAYLPLDCDQEFEAMAADFIKPQNEHLLDFHPHWRAYAGNNFQSVSDYIGQVMKLEEWNQLGIHHAQLSNRTMISFLDVLRFELHLNTDFIIPYNSGIRFHIQSCNVKGALRCSRYLCNPSDFDNNTMLLFITFTTVKANEDADTISREVPQLLIQARTQSSRPTQRLH